MVKKNNRNIILIIAFILLGIFILNILGVFDSSKFQLFSIVTPKQEYSTPYPCPIGEDIACNVRGVMYCEDSVGILNNVVFRTNGVWIAWDVDKDGNLNCFTPQGNPSPTGNLPISNFITLPDNMPIFGGKKFYGSVADIFTKKEEKPTNYIADIRLRPGVGCDLTPTEKEPFKSNKQEILSGESINPYSCSGEIKIEKSSTDKTVIYNETLFYNSQNSGKKLSQQKTINPGNMVFVTGGSTNKVESEVVDTTQACISGTSTCTSGDTGYYQCVNERPGEFVPCTGIYKCSNGRCVPPISSIDVSIKDSQGKEKVGFGINEQINIFVKVVSDFPMNVKISLREGSPEGNEAWSETRSIQSGVLNKFTTSLTELKKYYVFIEIDMGLTEKYYYGDDSNEEKYLRISPPISNSVNIKSPTQSRLFINNPIWVEINVYDSNGPAEADKINLDIRHKNIPVTNIPNYEIPPIISGNVLTYKYIFIFSTPGQLEVTSTAERAGLVSSPSSFSVRVEDISITTDFTNLGLFRCIAPSSQTLQFESKDSFGDYVDTTNKLNVVEPDTTIPKDISGLILRKELGKYEATYSFTKKGATTFKLESFSSDYNLGSSPRSGVIEVKDGCSPNECTQTKDCSTGNICVNGKCVIQDKPILLYLIFGGAIIFFIVLIIIIARLRKKTKVNMGGYNL